MKTIKVSELQPGPQMDALVAEARGWKLIDGAWCKIVFSGSEDDWPVINESDYNPSGNGGQCFDLIDLFNVEVCEGFPKHQGLQRKARVPYSNMEWQYSFDSKIAICKAVIASRLGETVEVEE